MNPLRERFPGTQYVLSLADGQKDSYRKQPADLIGHFSRERSAADAYRGRQLLELLQNADDAGEGFSGEKRVLLRLTESHLIVANTGHCFEPKGIRSLVVSDVSPKRLSRQRYIGNKGLGFRSILTWSSEPLIMSGEFLIAFSPDYAKQIASGLANELPELRDEMDAWQSERGLVPAPTLRFPYIPDSNDERAQIALSTLDEGYDTALVLPMTGGARRKQVQEDIIEQMGEVTGETVLFCRNVETLLIDGQRQRSWSLVREGPETRQTVLIREGEQTGRWTVLREAGTLPDELIEQELQETPEFEIAVGLPDSTDVSGSRRRLCVYFPTDDVLPCAMVAHATLATDESRKRLIQHDANRFILGKLAELMAKAAEHESTCKAPHRGLQLLSGIEGCDPELVALGFWDTLIASCKVRNICPRLDGSVRMSQETMRPPKQVWAEIADASVFPEMYAPGAGVGATSLLNALDLPWYGADSLARRLEDWVRALPPPGAGRIIGQLLMASAVPQGPPNLLLGSDAKPVPHGYTVFLSTNKGTVELPRWVERFAFAHSEFVDGLREVVGDIRDLRTKLNRAGYHTEEFQVESVARHLVEEATLAKQTKLFDHAALVVDTIGCIYKLACLQSDTESPIRVPLDVITTRRTVRRADQCYFGPAYPLGQLAVSLYGPLRIDEFLASPEDLNLQGDIEMVQRFLRRIGVVGEPRNVPISYAFQIPGFAQYILSRLDYPNTVFGNRIQSADEANRRLNVTFGGLSLPDRFQELLQKSDPEAILAYVLTVGRDHLNAANRGLATFQATQGSERTPRLYPFVNVPDPLFYLLRTQPWVPCDDGKRRTPEQIILSRTGRQVLGGIFFNHVLNGNHSSLASFSGAATVETVLRQLGAVYSLDSLRPDDLYRLLLELPVRDPDGRHSPGIYRALVESAGVDTDSTLRAVFVRDGKMWGTMHDADAYFPVVHLRYAPRFALPSPVRGRIPLVGIDPRRSAREIERIFGITQLDRDDFKIGVDPSSTERKSWSADANARLGKAIKYIYAYRLSRTEDETGRERAALRSAELVVCRRVAVSVSVLENQPEIVLLERDLDGLVLKDHKQLFLVSSTDYMPDDPVIWRAIGDLLADLIDVAGAASDFAQLLSCVGPAQMFRLLDLMTDGQAAKLISRATDRLEMDVDELGEITIPAPSTVNQETEVVPGPAQAQTEASPSLIHPSGVENSHAFEAIEPPEPRNTGRRSLVVTRRVESASRLTHVHRVDEDHSLRVAMLFESLEKRYPVRIEHVHGYESLGCDVLSFDDLESRKRLEQTGQADLASVARFVEVKGRSDRGGSIELTQNQRDAAEEFGTRYYVYRVYQDPASPERNQLAILCDPINGGSEVISHRFTYDFRRGSGAEWFELKEKPIAEKL